jgi:hypothetical protein
MMAHQQLNDVRDYFQQSKLKADDDMRRSMVKKSGDMVDQMRDIKKDKHVLRMRKD